MTKSKHEIVVLVGSLRKESLNRRFAEALVRLAPADFSFRFLDVNLPLFNQDEENKPTEAVARFRETVKAADGVVFVTPEYNRSIPGALKNAID
ncbi:MAG TPA: NADPH-dependent FMN reductase, partial [Fibrobacteria bacterium]|nr:NADPH-dependent FMN reductase [Fibrobacteria bacterium]